MGDRRRWAHQRRITVGAPPGVAEACGAVMLAWLALTTEPAGLQIDASQQNGPLASQRWQDHAAGP
jgi:hypothetical protein